MQKLLKISALLLGIFCWAHGGVSQAVAADLAAQAAGLRFYTAQPGDTFAILAERVHFDPELLAAMNNLSPGYCCRGGECLRLPTGSGLTDVAPGHRQQGESLTLAARGNNNQARQASWPIWQFPLPELGVVTSAFASDRGTSSHHGLDIAVPAGTPILAAHAGTVLEAGWKNSVYGYAVLIDHGNGWHTRYAHCSQVLVQPGQQVTQGQQIALVGSTGNSTGPHLHLELSKDSVYLNPARYFSELAV